MYLKSHNALLFFCGLIGSVLLSLSAAVQANQKIFSFGVVPQYDARQIKAIWQPILDQVSKQSGIQIELVGSPSIQIFEKQFQDGKFDFAYMNPYHLIRANQMQGYHPFLRDVGRSLHGIIVVLKDSPITTVAELQGKTVAFPAPNALGAALIPRAEFGEIYHLQINPKYVRSHDSVYLNVVLGQADAGGGVQNTLAKQPEKVRNALKIIYETQKLAPHPVSAHPRVSQRIVEKVTNAFIALEKTTEGRRMLEAIPIKQLGVTTLNDYDPLQKLGLEKYYVESQ